MTNSHPKLHRPLIFFTFFLVGINSIYFLFYKEKSQSTNQEVIKFSQTENSIRNKLEEPQITPQPISTIVTTPIATPIVSIENFNIKKGAWIPSFDTQNGLSSFVKNKIELSTVHYASGSINASGQAVFGANTEQTFGNIEKEDIPFGVNIIFSDYKGTELFLKNTRAQIDLQNKILGFKKFKNFKGINLNIEKVRAENKADLEKYLKEISLFLDKENLELYITIFPKTATSENTTPTKEALDYKLLNEVADKVVLMAYDYKIVEGANAKQDFANSPSFWVEEVIRYAKKDINTDKIIIGLPLYGYGFNKTTKNITKSYTYSQIENIIKTEKLTPTLDNLIGEMKLDRGNEIIIYQNQESLNIKYFYLKNLGINQVFFWRLGGEGQLNF